MTTAVSAAFAIFSITTSVLAALILALAIYALVCLYVAHRMTTPRRLAPMLDPAWQSGPPLQELRIASAHDAVPLAASWLPAEGASSAVLFVHGKDCCRGGEVRVSTAPLVHALHARGVSVLLLDLRGHGNSARSRMTYGIHEAGDVLGALNWLQAAGFASHNIGVFAASMGGAGALRAAMQQSSMGPMVLDSAYADFRTMIHSKFTFFTGLPRLFLPGSLVASRWLLKADVRKVRPVDDAACLEHRPVLVIHTGDDPFVPVADARRLAAAASAELWVTEGQHHLASFRDGPEGYVQRVLTFFENHLSVPRSDKNESALNTQARAPLAELVV